MNHKHTPLKPVTQTKVRSALFTSLFLATTLAHAEAPMHVDDASTMDKGGMKVEGTWRKDAKQKGGELLFGYSPMENLELEVAAARDRDSSTNPATHLRALGFGAKWVPIRNETGWSFGVKLDLGQTRVHDYETPQKYTGREIGINGLATYRLANGQIVHLNLGAVRSKAQGQSDTNATWGIGYEYPLAEKLKLTTEVFGQQHSKPDKALGLRYEIFDGFKVSGAAGRGNNRNFGQVGFSWEF